MNNKQFVEERIPEFLNVDVFEQPVEDEDVEEAIVIEAEHDDHTYKHELVFKDVAEDSVVKEQMIYRSIRTIIETATAH